MSKQSKNLQKPFNKIQQALTPILLYFLYMKSRMQQMNIFNFSIKLTNQKSSHKKIWKYESEKKLSIP